MITPNYVRVMARYNSEMNRRIYAGAERLSDAQRRADVGLFWKSLHGTLCHLMWGDRQWMSRLDGWPPNTVPNPQSPTLIEDLNSFSPWPRARPASGSRLGPRTMSATIRMMIRWVGWRMSVSMAVSFGGHEPAVAPRRATAGPAKSNGQNGWIATGGPASVSRPGAARRRLSWRSR